MSMTDINMTTEDIMCAINNLKGMYQSSLDKDETYLFAIKAFEEIQQYRAIGTVEEFKMLKEKERAEKPRFYAHNYYCKSCGQLVGNNEFEWQRFLYCDTCGQKLDWNERGRIWQMKC